MTTGDLLRKIYTYTSKAFAFARVTLANLLVLLAVLLVVVLLVSGPERPPVADGTALLVAPKGAIVEQTSTQDPLSLLTAGSLAQTPIHDLLRAIEEAGRDSRIGALVLDTSDLGYVAPAHLETIGDALAAFRETGKTIVAKSRYYSRDQYYLASFADDVFLHPMGEVALNGYGAYRDYYAGLFDKLKVNVHVFRVGTYKAFVEPYTRTDMSPAAKEANQELVDALWTRFVARVAANRGLEPQAVIDYADHFDEALAAAGGNAAEAALAHGLVDELLATAPLSKRLIALAGGTETYRHVAVGDYLRPQPPPLFGTKVAIVHASGPILMGSQPRGTIGAASMAKLLRRVRNDGAIGALVLRVDSGGGSALASELIRQELERVQNAGKPVVVSMAGTAASGGYWIAATADEIWAAPTTITGSIGIFAIVPTLEDSLGAVGVTRDGVATGPFVGALDVRGGVGDAMGRALQASIDHGYEQFVGLVARGRDMTPEQVDAIAQGRVWTGESALRHGLVDKLGDLDDAVASAAALAGIERYGVFRVEEPLSPMQVFVNRLLDDVGLARSRPPAFNASALAGGILRDVLALNALNDPRHLYALCAVCGGLR